MLVTVLYKHAHGAEQLKSFLRIFHRQCSDRVPCRFLSSFAHVPNHRLLGAVATLRLMKLSGKGYFFLAGKRRGQRPCAFDHARTEVLENMRKQGSLLEIVRSWQEGSCKQS